jgi:hypothetical protein
LLNCSISDTTKAQYASTLQSPHVSPKRAILFHCKSEKESVLLNNSFKLVIIESTACFCASLMLKFSVSILVNIALFTAKNSEYNNIPNFFNFFIIILHFTKIKISSFVYCFNYIAKSTFFQFYITFIIFIKYFIEKFRPRAPNS